MARIRSIKPDFFLDEDLAAISPLARLLFIGLWGLADREGRLEWRSKRIKAQILPWDECNLDALLGELVRAGNAVRYDIASRAYVQIRNFTKHQKPHQSEAPSVIPAPPGEALNDRSSKNTFETHGREEGVDSDPLVVDGGGESRAPTHEATFDEFNPSDLPGDSVKLIAGRLLGGEALWAFCRMWHLHPNKDYLDAAVKEFKRKVPQGDLQAIARVEQAHKAWCESGRWANKAPQLNFWLSDGGFRSPPTALVRAQGPPPRRPGMRTADQVLAGLLAQGGNS